MKLIEISADCFNISKRIKEIDKSYKLFYNKKEDRFEVYSNYGMKTKCECIFKNLTVELLIKLLKTRRENLDALIREMDIENEKRKKRLADEAIKEVQRTMDCFL